MKKRDVRYKPSNEIAKYKFFRWLEHDDAKDPKTVLQYVKAIHEYEVALDFEEFTKFNADSAIKFKRHMNNKKNARTGDDISKSTYSHYLKNVQKFFNWLIDEKINEYRKLKKSDVRYFNITQNDANKAKATNIQESYKVSEILSTIRKMPEETILQKRDKAIISLRLLTVPRTASLKTARIKSVRYLDEYEAWAFIQDPRLQDVKFAKNITSFFIGQSQDIIDNVIKWKEFLIEQGFKDNDYLFPKIISPFNQDRKNQLALTKEYMRKDESISKIFKKAFADNNLKYIKPHNFRHSIARLVRKMPNAFDITLALEENYGHKSKNSTMVNSYMQEFTQQRADKMKSILFE